MVFEVVESITKAKDNEGLNLEKLLMHYKLKEILQCPPAVRISSFQTGDPHFLYNFTGMWETQVNCIAFEVVESITREKDNEEINFEKLLMRCKLKVILQCPPAVRIYSFHPEDPLILI